MVYGFGENNSGRYYAELYPGSRFGAETSIASPAVDGAERAHFVPIQPVLQQAQQEWGLLRGSVNFYPAKVKYLPAEFYQISAMTALLDSTSLNFDLSMGKNC